MAKKIECKDCKGLGYEENKLLQRVECWTCKGLGYVMSKEDRKPILVSAEYHAKLKDLAYENKKSLKEFLEHIIDDFSKK